MLVSKISTQVKELEGMSQTLLLSGKKDTGLVPSGSHNSKGLLEAEGSLTSATDGKILTLEFAASGKNYKK